MNEKKKKKPEGFSNILHELQVKLEQTDSVLEKVNKLLTLDERIPMEDGLDSLSDLQLAIYEQVVKHEERLVYSTDVDLNADGIWVTLGIKSYGRIVFGEYDPSKLHGYDVSEPGDISVGFIMFPVDVYEKAVEAYKTQFKQQQPIWDEALQFMNQLSPQERNDIVLNIHFICYHMAPVLYYTEHKTVTNFYDYNNFIQAMGGSSSQFLLDDLVDTPIHEWSDETCLLIYSLQVLFKSGPPARGEEFNGKQVNPVRLQQFLIRKWEHYEMMASDPHMMASRNAFLNANLIVKAEMLCAARSRLTDQFTFYRQVNGLNLLKKESLYPSNEMDEWTETLPEDIQHYFDHIHNMNVTSFDDLYPAVQTLMKSNLSGGMHPDIMSPLEELIHVTVDSAVRSTQSDMGMSRSMRDFSELIRVHDQQLIEDACNWKQTDFFCCVVPSARLVKALCDKGPLLPGILKSVSIRMQYNSWHYTPGNFPRELLPEDRHFYFPPVMPDTAVWSDQHHRGHIHASVRYSIRSPYHITYKGKRYAAFFDLRLMRQRGDAYTLSDMQQAVRYTLYLNRIYQAILDAQAEYGISFKFTAFTKEWYDRFYGPNTIYKEEVYAI